jgi:hypothetical protein
MLRYLTVAAALAVVMSATAARAAVISGTWSFVVDEWPLLSPHAPFPRLPAKGSATFSLDTAVLVEGVPVTNFSSSFGSAPPAYSYGDGSDTLLIIFNGPGYFIEAKFIDIAVHVIEPSVPPILQGVFLIPSLNESIAAADFSGGFAPAVPEPPTWIMLLLGFAGFGLVANHRRKAHHETNRRPGLPSAAVKAAG